MFLSYSFLEDSLYRQCPYRRLCRASGHARYNFLNPHLNMTDILYILTSIGFFALMIAFIWGCEKI